MNTASSMATIANRKKFLQADQLSVEVHHGQMDLLTQTSQTLPNGTQVCDASSSSWFSWWYAIFPRGLSETQISAHTLKYTYHQKPSFNGEESLPVDSNSQRAQLSNISSVSMALDCPPGYVGNWNDGSIIESVDKLLQTGESECFLCKCPYVHLDALRCLNCEHVFHKACIDEYLKNGVKCPRCKRAVMPKRAPFTECSMA